MTTSKLFACLLLALLCGADSAAGARRHKQFRRADPRLVEHHVLAQLDGGDGEGPMPESNFVVVELPGINLQQLLAQQLATSAAKPATKPRPAQISFSHDRDSVLHQQQQLLLQQLHQQEQHHQQHHQQQQQQQQQQQHQQQHQQQPRPQQERPIRPGQTFVTPFGLTIALPDGFNFGLPTRSPPTSSGLSSHLDYPVPTPFSPFYGPSFGLNPLYSPYPFAPISPFWQQNYFRPSYSYPFSQPWPLFPRDQPRDLPRFMPRPQHSPAESSTRRFANSSPYSPYNYILNSGAEMPNM